MLSLPAELKYTFISLYRRYYGRVQQAVHEFLAMGPDVVKAGRFHNTFDFYLSRGLLF